MANEYSTVDCNEEAFTPRYNGAEDAVSASVVLSCTFANYAALIADICGNANVFPHPAPGTLVLRARSAALTGIRGEHDNDGQMCDYANAQALVTVNYDAKLEEIASETFEPSAQFYPLDYRLFRWGAADGPLVRKEESGGFLVKTATFTRTIYRLESGDIPSGLLDYFGGVNESAVVGTITGLTFPAETLLFEAPVYDTKFRSDGQQLTDLSLRWTFRQQGWNKFYRPDTNAWESMYIVGGAEYKPYTPIDMSDMF